MSQSVKRRGLRIDRNGWELLSMVSLSVLFLGVFAYIPMFGIILAFKDGDGVLNLTNAMFQSDWVGFYNFKEFFLDLFHSMGDMLTTGIYVCELDAADLSNIKGATRQNAVTNFGLVDPGAAVPTFADTDFKLDSESGMLYAVRNYYPVAATAPNLPIAVQLISMPLADLYKANSEWTVIEEQINDLDLSTAENDGWERVYSACIVGDEYGRVDNATSLELNLTVTSYDKETFEYLYYQAITSCTVTLS